MQLQIDKLGKVAVTVEQSYWSNEKDYDRLTIVEAPKGEYKTYISRKPVPAGTVLTNREYWIPFSSLKEEIVIDFNEFVASLTEAMQQTKDYADNTIEQGIEDITAIKEEAMRIITYIAENGIDSTVLAPNSVTSEKIKAGNVLSEHIGAGEVKSANIGAGEVKSGNIGEGEVKSANIGTGEVKSGNIGEGEVKEGHIAPGAITTEKLDTPVITQLQTIMDDTPTSDSEKPVNSGGVFNSVIRSGVFDLSAHTGDSYADLSAALTAMNALPAAYKKGGMSIKYVQSSDNNYVQYRLMSPTWSIVISDWQGVDDEPTADSENLVQSGGVKIELDKKLDKVIGSNLVNPNSLLSGAALSMGSTDGIPSTGFASLYKVSDYIPVNGQNIISNAYYVEGSWTSMFIYDTEKRFLRNNGTSRQYTFQEGDGYVRIGYHTYDMLAANYGNVLTTEEYTENAPVAALEKTTSDLEKTTSDLVAYIPDAIETSINKVDKIVGVNLVDRTKITTGKAIRWDGVLSDATNYFVSDYIPIKGNDIISSGYYNGNTWSCYAVYDKNKKLLRGGYASTQYTYQEGDAYIRISLSSIITGRANYGTVLYPYSDYTDNAPLDARLAAIDENKISKRQNGNILDPSLAQIDRYIDANGNIATSGSTYIGAYVSPKIPINGSNLTATPCNVTPSARPWVAYDEHGMVTRVGAVGVSTVTYVFDQTNYPNDKFIVFGFRSTDLNPSIFRISYGNSIIDKPYTEYLPLAEVEQRVTALEGDVETIGEVVDTISGFLYSEEIGEEASDRGAIAQSYIGKNSQGTTRIVTSASASYSLIYYPVIAGKAYFIKAVAAINTGAEIIKIAAFTTSLPAINVECSLIFEDYVLAKDTIYKFVPSSNGYVVLYNRSDGKPVLLFNSQKVSVINELDKRVDALEVEVEPTSGVELSFVPNAIYKVWNNIDTSRQNVAKLWLSRMLSRDANLNENVHFDNGLRFLPIVPSSVSQVTEASLNINVGGESAQCVVRNTPASLSVNSKPRILIIGDSVTSGYGAGYNKSVSWHPSRYWGYAKMLFEMDKIDNNDSGHAALFVGGVISSDTFTINYKSISREVRVKAEGKGGAALQQLYDERWGDSNSENPFYDSVNDTFSIVAYLNNYRTMDDAGVRLVSNSADPHGESVTGSDGNTYTIGQKITTQALLGSIDVCTPTHVFINLNHNTTDANFKANISNVVNTVKTELPGVVFAWLVIDSTGTNFPKDYPEFDQTMIRFDALHTKNCGFFNYFHENLEDEENDVYLLGMNFVQPEAIDYAFTEVEINGGWGDTYKIANDAVSGRTYHPNNIAHAAWGYELYAFIKWLISK